MRGVQSLPITVEAVTVKREFDAEVKIKYKLYYVGTLRGTLLCGSGKTRPWLKSTERR